MLQFSLYTFYQEGRDRADVCQLRTSGDGTWRVKRRTWRANGQRKRTPCRCTPSLMDGTVSWCSLKFQSVITPSLTGDSNHPSFCSVKFTTDQPQAEQLAIKIKLGVDLTSLTSKLSFSKLGEEQAY